MTSATDDPKKDNAIGFSGLSTLVSDVGNAPSVEKASAAVPLSQSDTQHPETVQGREVDTSVPAESSTRHSVEPNGGSPGVTTGVWMVGVGLIIGLFVIIQLNSTTSESPRPVQAPVVQAPPAVAPDPVVPASKTMPPRFKRVPESLPPPLPPPRMATESVEALGQRVTFSNPTGYCTPGNSARELELMDVARRSMGEGTRLLHAAVFCSELEAYRKGRRETLDHWLQIQLIGPKGNFQRMEMTRDAFLTGVSKSSAKLDQAEINRRLKAAFDGRDISMSHMDIEPLGRDGNAAYFSIRMNMTIGETSRPIAGISGITLLNSLPISVTVYDGTNSPKGRAKLQSVQQELLNSLLTAN